MLRSNKTHGALLGAVAALTLSSGTLQAQEDPIKVGVLHSLSGTMAISETTLKDAVVMLVAAQNAKGGLLGRPLEAVVVEHDMEFVRDLDAKTTVLHEGRVLAEGSIEAVQNNPDVVEVYLGR